MGLPQDVSLLQKELQAEDFLILQEAQPATLNGLRIFCFKCEYQKEQLLIFHQHSFNEAAIWSISQESHFLFN